MVSALCLSKRTSLDEWGSFEFGRAARAYSRARRFREWLRNPRIDPGFLLHPLTEHLISKVGKHIYIALNTSIYFNAFCMVRVSLIFLDRAVPLVWSVRKSKSALVPFSAYQGLLEEVAAMIPSGTQPRNPGTSSPSEAISRTSSAATRNISASKRSFSTRRAGVSVFRRAGYATRRGSSGCCA